MQSSLVVVALTIVLTAPSAALEVVQKATSAHEPGVAEVLLLFWTTKCVPCGAHMRSWNDLGREADTEGLEVLSDPALDLARADGLRELPSVVVVRPQGRVRRSSPRRGSLWRVCGRSWVR
jgi:hypothetical protein